MSDPVRLAAVELLSSSDRSPAELQHRLSVSSNLLSHHLEVLETAGLISRTRSSGDGRRRYVRLRAEALEQLRPRTSIPRQPALFVCSANAARSQLGAALWMAIVGRRATSAGTAPAAEVHPQAVAAARRAGLDLTAARPRRLGPVPPGGLVVTVCDVAHEGLGDRPDWLHWSIPDPASDGSPAAFDRTVDELRSRIQRVVAGA